MNHFSLWKRDILIILLVSLFYFSAFLVLNSGKTFRLDSDYDMLFSYYTPVIEHVRTFGIPPRIHPYAGFGLPLAGDPGISFYNPLFLIPIVLFGMISGTYVLMWLLMFFSGISMWIFLSHLRTDRTIKLWGSLLYIVSGGLAARFASGHVIFFLTYPIWPLTFTYLLFRSPHKPVLFSLLLSYFFLSGDIYGVWFAGIFFGITQVIHLISHTISLKQFFVSSILTLVYVLLICSPKLYFLFTDAIPVFDRTFRGNPSEGSIHLWWTVLPFLVPFTVSFYDRPFFQQHLGFYFNWYEYYAFLSPLPFLFFIPVLRTFIYKGRKNLTTYYVLLIIFFLAGLLYVALAFPYSPFYWLFTVIPQLSIFRVPQRMYLPLSSVLIALFCLGAQQWKRKNRSTVLFHTILWISLLWTVITSLNALQLATEPPRTREKALITWLRTTDPGEYFVLDILCCTQVFLVEEKIPIINFYAGWVPKGTPSFKDETGERWDYSKLHTVRPTYILSNNTDDFSKYTYSKIYQTDIGSIWKTEQSTLKPNSLQR